MARAYCAAHYCLFWEDVTRMKLVRRQTGTLKLLKPRLMRTFDLKRLVLKIVVVFCAQHNCDGWSHCTYVSTQKSLRFKLVVARGRKGPRVVHLSSCMTEGCRRGPRPSCSTAERSSLFAFPLHLHTWFSLLSVKHGLCYKLLRSTRNRSEDSRLSLTNCFQQDFITLSAPWRFSPVIMLFAFPSPHLGLVCPLGRPKLAQSEVM